MKPVMKVKISIDAAMTLALLLLMAYGLVGEAAHEWLGMGMFALFLLHHLLNRRWIRAMPQGRYAPPRIVQTVLTLLLLLTMLGSMVSGVIVSRYVFPFQAGFGLTSWAEKLHMLCAYWGFVLMSLHLGMHWNMVLAMMRKHLTPFKPRTWCLRLLAYLWAAYGAVAFVRRDVWRYLLLKSHFVFFDYTEPLVRFLLDYLAVMSLFVLAGYWLARALRPKGQ